MSLYDHNIICLKIEFSKVGANNPLAEIYQSEMQLTLPSQKAQREFVQKVRSHQDQSDIWTIPYRTDSSSLLYIVTEHVLAAARTAFSLVPDDKLKASVNLNGESLVSEVIDRPLRL